MKLPITPKRIIIWLSNIFRIGTKLANHRRQLTKLQRDVLYLKLLQFHESNPEQEYDIEVNYLKGLGHLTMFPYKRLKDASNFDTGFDDKQKMPFIIHNGKRLYFPGDFTINKMVVTYRIFIEEECLFGGGYTEKSPHQYITSEHNVQQNDVIIDIGAAEGLFSLNFVDTARQIYIIESEKYWIKALRATFGPYREKVKIINKYATNKNSRTQIAIDTIEGSGSGGYFLKLDVEGFEYLVLSGASNLLQKTDNIRVSCCTYHKHDDAEELNKLLTDFGFRTEFSEGYMILFYDQEIKAPYFRKGILRAQKVNGGLNDH